MQASQGFSILGVQKIDLIRYPKAGPQALYPSDAVEPILSFVESPTTDKPYLIFTNIYDPHGPWNHAAGNKQTTLGNKSETKFERYLQEVQLADKAIGEIVIENKKI